MKLAMKPLCITGGVLVVLALSPIVFFFIGEILNQIWNCGIIDESGNATGNCTESQADIAYALLMSPWFLLLTVPFFGSGATICFLSAILLHLYRKNTDAVMK